MKTQNSRAKKGKGKGSANAGKSASPMGEEIRSAPLWAASRTLLAGQGEEFFSRWSKAVKGFQEDDVHDLRVASRRLREGLALFSSCFPRKKNLWLAKQVKKVTGMLGDLRNTDEAFLFFSSLTAEETAHSGKEIEKLLTGFTQERDRAHKRLKKDLKSLDPEPLQAEFDALRDRPSLFGVTDVDPFMSMKSFAGDAIMERADTVAELLPAAVQETDSAAQHQLRIAMKRMRYRLEIIAPLLESGYQELHDTLKGYQDVLGKLHDIDVFIQMVRERVEEGASRQGLLRTLAERRSRLFASFIEMQKGFPIESMGERIRGAL